MASGSDSNGQGCGYFQIIYFCPNCKTPVDPLPWDYRGLPLYFDVLPTQMYPAWYGNQVQSTDEMELFDPVVPQSDGGLDLVPQLGPVFVSVPQTDPLLVGVPHSDDVLGRIPQVVVDLMRSVPCFIDGSAVMAGSSHFEPSFEPNAAPDVTFSSDRPVDALMDEFMKSVPRFLETEDRNGRFSFEATFSKLWVRDGASNASIFATADGHSILLCHPLAKVWVQGGQVCATFSLPNQEQRHVKMDDVITFTAKRTATRKRCSVNVLDANGQRTDRQKLDDLDLITTENAFAENDGIIPPEAGKTDLRLTGEHFSYKMADKLAIRWRENRLSIRTARLNVSAELGDDCAPHVDVCKLSADGRSEQMICFDGKHFHARHDQQSATLVDGNLISTPWDHQHVARGL